MRDVHIDWMKRRDMPEVLRIEQLSYNHPWCEEDFHRCLRQRNCIGMVADCSEGVAGFMIYELRKSKICVLNLAVHFDRRRSGVGTMLVEKLVSKLSWDRRTRFEIDVCECNLGAQLFLRARGLRATGVSRGEGPDGRDVYTFRYDLVPAEVV